MTLQKLSSFAEIIMGQSPKGSSYNNEGKGVPLLNGAADFNKKKIIPKNYTTAPTKICRKGDILLCIRATIGNAIISDKEYCLGRGVCAIRVKDKKVHPKFILFLLEKKVIELAERAEGSTIKGIRKEAMENLEFEIPSYEKQEKMVAILERVEKLKEKQKQSTDEINTLFDALMQKAFNGELVI